MKATYLTLALTSLAFTGPVGAFVIASTNFNGRVLDPDNTATNLNWTLNGVADPGGIAAFQANGTTAQALFNNTFLTQNLFAPALNTGNGNTYWIANVALTPLGGPTISIQDVTFDYWAVNGSGVQNVDRRADFDVTLFDPSMSPVGSVFANVLNGTGVSNGAGTPVTLTFASPIELSQPGTYILRIRGGDIINDETGNHTAIDNLSINAVPEPGVVLLGSLGLLGLLRRRR